MYMYVGRCVSLNAGIHHLYSHTHDTCAPASSRSLDVTSILLWLIPRRSSTKKCILGSNHNAPSAIHLGSRAFLRVRGCRFRIACDPWLQGKLVQTR